ncbi:MAG: TonB-dependent receptor [Cellvibrionaceae bacterium]|nr:TonB-dependent receptor [Cellvibrionaceae bacterium]
MTSKLPLAASLLMLTAQPAIAADELEQLTVTAEKTPQAQTSVAIGQVNDKELERIAPVHINEALARVSGTWVSRGNGQEHLTALRSPVFTGPGSCGEYLVAEDGIPTRPVGFCNVNQLLELNSEQAGAIEVLKGPGTVFYGSNALHGIINVLSPSPRQGGRLSLQAGPDDYGRAQLRWGQQFNQQKLELRLSGSSDGGYKDASGYDQQKLGLRHDYQGEGFSSQTLLSASNLQQETAGYIYGENAYQDSDIKRTNPNPEAYRNAKALRLSSRLEWHLDAGSLAITPYVRHSEMDFIQHFLPGQALEANEQQSFGAQALWQQAWSENLDWRIGVDVEWADMQLREYQPGPTDHPSAFLRATIPQGLHYDYQVDSQVGAIYSSWRWQPAAATTIDWGLRYESLRYDYDNRTTDGALKVDGSPCTLFGSVKTCRHARPADRRDSYDNVSYQLGLQQGLSERWQLFGRLAKSFRAPQTSELYRLQKGQLEANLDSESLASIELGLRYSGTDLALSLASYAMEKEDYIFRDTDGFYIDAGETEHAGLELDLNYRLGPQWQLGLVASYARHQYSNNPDAGLGNIDGNDVDTAPRRQANGRVLWQPFAQLQAELEWVYLGEHYLDPQNQHRYKGHSLFNLRLAYELQDWQLSARMTNLADRDYAERADYAFGQYRYFVGQGRGLYLGAAYRW